MKISQKVINKKLLVVYLLITFIFLSLIGRLFYIQVIDSKNLVGLASSQWNRSLPLIANRGYILDRNGVVLASSTTKYTLYARVNEIKNANNLAEVLAGYLNEDKDALYKKLTKKGQSEITIKKEIEKDTVLKIIQLNAPGLYLTSDSKRMYPYNNFLTQLLGFTSIDNKGQSGLELLYDSYLLGINGESLTKSDLVGNKVFGSKTKYIPTVDGMNVNLTIDYYIQSFVEKAVKDAITQYSANSSSCIVMNANTGEILAIASAPTYDLNNIPRDDLALLNKQSKMLSLTDIYEPGSVFKVLTSAIGIEENKIKKSYYCPGYSIVDGQRIRCWRSKGHGSQTFEEGICNSCNCVFMDVALSCGVDTMYSYYEKFGITSKTGIDYPGESSSILLKQDSVKNVDLARIGFGQAIALTPIQLITAFSSVINGGNLYKPYIVKNVVDSSTSLVAVSNNTTLKNKTVSSDVSRKMVENLINVVENGSGKNAKVDGYVIGGKTGTSQKYENGKIAQGKYVSSFCGFSEINGDNIVCLFLVDEPKGYMYYGSLVAAPYVKDIFSGIFQYKNITPNIELSKKVLMPDLMGMELHQAIAQIENINLQYEYSGEMGKVTYQFPAPNTQINENSVIFFSVER